MRHNLVILLGLSLLISCSPTEENKDILNVALPIEPVGLYPYLANDPHSARVNALIYDALLKIDTNGEIVPVLATDWEYKSPTVLDMMIRTNVFFHNGDPLTLEDVQFSYEQILSTPSFALTVAAIDRTEITEEGKFRVILKEPYSPLLSLLSYFNFMIVNKKYVLANQEDISQISMGTGPYKLKEWNRGQNVVLERSDVYWNTPARIGTVNFRTVNDPVARAIALETGDVDIAYDIEGIDKVRLIEDPNIMIIEKAIPRVEYIAMNIGKGSNPLWKDKRGRQAFAYAIDYEGIVNSVLFGMGETSGSLLPPMVSFYDNDLPIKKQDIAKAKSLIKEMGFAETPKAKIWVREGINQKVGEVLQANLSEIGVDVTLEVVEYARFLEGIARGDHDVFILNWTTVTADADYGLNNLLNSESWGSKGNRSFYANAEIDRLLAKGRASLANNERREYYRKVQEIVYDDVPYIPLYYSVLGAGMSKNVKGFVFDYFSNHPLHGVYFEE